MTFQKASATLRTTNGWHIVLAGMFAGLAAILFCGDILRNLDYWGRYDWGLFFFHAYSNYRSVVEFGELPLWDPWYIGGFPKIGNPQAASFNPSFLVDLLFGPVVAFKLKILICYAAGLGGMYWCCRQFGLCRLGSLYAAGTFWFSTWLSLRIHSGHATYLTVAYIPWIVGLLYRSGERPSRAIYPGIILALVVLEGGIAHCVTLFGVVCGLLTIGWAIQQRSLKPVAALFLMGAAGAGLSAVKLLPSLELITSIPRQTSAGGSSWSGYRAFYSNGHPSTTAKARVSERAPSPSVSDERDRGPSIEDPGDRPTTAAERRPSRSDLPAFLLKILLGRDQESDVFYFPLQGFGWQEYGTYLGPLAIFLLLGSPLLLRTAWPWLFVAAFCFLIAVGNFSRFAPWTLMHHLPVFRSMRAPSRFLIPFAFAGCVLAGMVLDAIRRRWAAGQDRRGRRTEFVVRILVAAALIDSIVVGRSSLRGSFPTPPPSIAPRLPAIVTISGRKMPMTQAMLANYCVLDTPEAIPFPISALPRDHPDYRGELEFVGDGAGSRSGAGRVELEDWSPNSVRVRVAADAPGFVVVNRNWEEGWTVTPPYEITRLQGRIASKVEPGSHTLTFSYRPRIVLLGAVISLVTLVSMTAWIIVSRITAGTSASGDRRRAMGPTN